MCTKNHIKRNHKNVIKPNFDVLRMKIPVNPSSAKIKFIFPFIPNSALTIDESTRALPPSCCQGSDGVIHTAGTRYLMITTSLFSGFEL